MDYLILFTITIFVSFYGTSIPPDGQSERDIRLWFPRVEIGLSRYQLMGGQHAREGFVFRKYIGLVGRKVTICYCVVTTL